MAELEVRRPSNGHVLASFPIYSDRRYRLPSGDEIRVGNDYGWCRSCRNFSAIERLWTQTEIENNRDNLLLVAQSLTEAEVETKRRNAINWLRDRRTPVRCLTCGSIFGFTTITPGVEQPHPDGDGLVVLTSDGALGGGPPTSIPEYYAPDGTRLASDHG
jgi:hypothetical protein